MRLSVTTADLWLPATPSSQPGTAGGIKALSLSSLNPLLSPISVPKPSLILQGCFALPMHLWDQATVLCGELILTPTCGLLPQHTARGGQPKLKMILGRVYWPPLRAVVAAHSTASTVSGQGKHWGALHKWQ